MRDVSIYIDEIILDAGILDRAEFEAGFRAELLRLVAEYDGEYRAGAAPVLLGAPAPAAAGGVEVARSVWHSMIPGGDRP